MPYFQTFQIIFKNSVLVFNNTKVLKARVVAHRKTGAKIECFFLKTKRKIDGNIT